MVDEIGSPTTVTVAIAVWVPPSESVTRRVTLYEPAVVKSRLEA